MNIAVFGSSVASQGGIATVAYCRSVVQALRAWGHRVTFCAPDAATLEDTVDRARDADAVIVTSGRDPRHAAVEDAVLALRRPQCLAAWWDVTPVEALARLRAEPGLAARLRQYDGIVTAGGDAVRAAYHAHGVVVCVSVRPAREPGGAMSVAASSAELVATLVRLLRDTDPSELAAVGVRAQTRVLAEHTVAHRAHALERYLAECDTGCSSSNSARTAATVSASSGRLSGR